MFQKAVKHESKLRMAIYGPSGSGKTYTSLRIATALGGKIACIDTERGSASKYADEFAFDVLNLDPPYHPQRILDAIAEAEAAGYDIVIIDSLTHAYNGSGGLLEIVDEEAKKSKSGNTYIAWGKGTPIQQKLIDGMTRCKMHVFGTMRSKTEYVVETNDRGKSTPRKIGTAPIQRDGMEYEFDVCLDMNNDNEGIVQKTRCSALAGRVFSKPGADVAKILAAWLRGEKPAPVAPKPERAQAPGPQTVPARSTTRQDEAERNRLINRAKALSMELDAVKDGDGNLIVEESTEQRRLRFVAWQQAGYLKRTPLEKGLPNFATFTPEELRETIKLYEAAQSPAQEEDLVKKAHGLFNGEVVES